MFATPSRHLARRFARRFATYAFFAAKRKRAANRAAALDFCAAVLLYYMRQRASVWRCAVVRELSGNGKRQD